MAFRIRKSPEATDPRDHHWDATGFAPGTTSPYNYIISSPGAYDWAAFLAPGMVLHHSVVSTPLFRQYFWQVDTILIAQYFRWAWVFVAPHDPAIDQVTMTLKVAIAYFHPPTPQYFGEINLKSPDPISLFRVPLTTYLPLPGNPDVIPNHYIDFQPCRWNTAETPGGD